MSHAATNRRGGWIKGGHWREANRYVLVKDVSRSYFYAQATREARSLNFPDADDEAQEGEVGRLNVCLYGTRDAARAWQEALSKRIEGIGLKMG